MHLKFLVAIALVLVRVSDEDNLQLFLPLVVRLQIIRALNQQQAMAHLVVAMISSTTIHLMGQSLTIPLDWMLLRLVGKQKRSQFRLMPLSKLQSQLRLTT